MVVVLCALLCSSALPVWGVSKEIVQLQTQVEQLQQQMTLMQQSFNERMGVMKNLVEQNTDSMNKLSTDDLHAAEFHRQEPNGSHRTSRSNLRTDPIVERHDGRVEGSSCEGLQAA